MLLHVCTAKLLICSAIWVDCFWLLSICDTHLYLCHNDRVLFIRCQDQTWTPCRKWRKCCEGCAGDRREWTPWGQVITGTSSSSAVCRRMWCWQTCCSLCVGSRRTATQTRWTWTSWSRPWLCSKREQRSELVCWGFFGFNNCVMFSLLWLQATESCQILLRYFSRAIFSCQGMSTSRCWHYTLWNM